MLGNSSPHSALLVLILVLVEHTLGALNEKQKYVIILVLILVLVEHTLGDDRVRVIDGKKVS